MTEPLSFDSESAFQHAFPEARWCRKAADPRFPTFTIDLCGPIAVKKPWGPDGAFIEVDCDPKTHVLLVNTATGECYPCKAALDEAGILVPVGYVVSDACIAETVFEFVSEPVLAVEVTGAPVQIQTFEGVHEAPVGAWLCFSASKGLYHVKSDKWTLMGYAPVES